MEIPTLKCTVCSRNIDPFDVRYHNAEKTAAFCDAKCSLQWYHENDDYYKKEIAYQQIIDANANNKALATNPLIMHNEQFIHIQFPSTLHDQLITGIIELYNAANAKNDTSISFSTSNDSVSIALNNIKKGNYTAKIQYASERINYYSETALNLFE